jgi:hypothetical protein
MLKKHETAIQEREYATVMNERRAKELEMDKMRAEMAEEFETNFKA